MKKIYIVWAFLLYIMITLFTMWINYKYPDLIDQNFYTSYMASTWEDILFFGLVGAAVSIMSLRNPKDDNLVERIRALYSFSDDLSNKIEDAVIDSTKKVAICATVNNIKVSISEYNPSLDAIKVFVSQEIRLANLIHDEAYTYQRPVNFVLDDFEPAPNPRGRIIEASFTDQALNKEKFYEYECIQNKEWSFTVTENLPANGYGITTLNYWIWYKNGESWSFKNHHHTEKVNIILSVDDDTMHGKVLIQFNDQNIKPNDGNAVVLDTPGFHPINSLINFKFTYKKDEEEAES